MLNLRPTNGWDLLASVGHPCKFQRVSRLGSVTAPHSSSGRQPNFAALNRDMIEVFKITHNIYDPEVSPELRYYPKSNTRGNKYKLLNHYDTRKYSFTAHMVNIWNSLPNSVVDVDTVCLFEARLDKFWMHQDVLYDFTADLTGIGDRSVRESS